MVCSTSFAKTTRSRCREVKRLDLERVVQVMLLGAMALFMSGCLDQASEEPEEPGEPQEQDSQDDGDESAEENEAKAEPEELQLTQEELERLLRILRDHEEEGERLREALLRQRRVQVERDW